MARQKRKAKEQNLFGVVLDFVDVADAIFSKLTGKTIAVWLKEFQQQPRELPLGEETTPTQPAMPLADAYAVMGLKPDCSLSDVKNRYRNLANLFHPDKGGYVEAMKLLNQAYEQIKRAKRE